MTCQEWVSEGLCVDEKVKKKCCESCPNTTCDLNAVVYFPQDLEGYYYYDYYGYHNDYVKVVKSGDENPCWYDQTTTDWGCIHNGDALVENFSGYANKKQNETVSIAGVNNGIFHFYLEHFFNDELENYDNYKDSEMTANLAISIAGKPFGLFSHDANIGVDTHTTDGTINPEYNGDTVVTVTCDDDCNCEVEQLCNVCEIKAEIKFPSLSAAEAEGYYGYHNDFISVKRNGFDDICYYDADGETDWGCKHNGEAKFERYYDDKLEKFSETESVAVCNAMGGTFDFSINHYFTANDSSSPQSELDHLLKGTLSIFINGEDYGEYAHDVDKDINTHDADGNVNPLYDSQKTINVACDGACNCVIVPLMS